MDNNEMMHGSIKEAAVQAGAAGCIALSARYRNVYYGHVHDHKYVNLGLLRPQVIAFF